MIARPFVTTLSRPNPALTAALICLLAIVDLSACNLGYGAPVERARFGSAALHEDGQRCVFALHDMVYRPAEGMRAFPDGGIPRYEVDRHKIGIADVRTKDVTILVDDKNRDWLSGHGGYHIAGVHGRWALVRQSGQRDDYKQDHRWLRLDLVSGDLTELPLDEEIAEQSLELSRPELVADDFTLILVTRKGDIPQQIWSRSQDGSLMHLTTTEHYYGTAEGQVWWYDVAARAGARTDYKSGKTIRERRANFAMPRSEPGRVCKASFDGTDLILQEKIGGDWESRRLGVEAASLR
jgi:hypothetical protein